MLRAVLLSLSLITACNNFEPDSRDAFSVPVWGSCRDDPYEAHSGLQLCEENLLCKGSLCSPKCSFDSDCPVVDGVAGQCDGEGCLFYCDYPRLGKDAPCPETGEDPLRCLELRFCSPE